MKLFFSACLLLVMATAFHSAHAQDLTVSKNDSAALHGIWKQFLAAISTKDDALLKTLSLSEVYCIICKAAKGEDNFLVPADVFAQSIFKLSERSTLWESMKGSEFRPYLYVQEDYKPANMPEHKEEDLALFQLSYVSRYPSTLEPSHEGANMIFQFVKTVEGFRFYGMYSVP